jgi:hypothetical protein
MGSPAVLELTEFNDTRRRQPAMSIEVIPPPFVITDEDKRGLIVVTTATALSFIWTCLLVRTWQRLHTREWKWDDYLLLAATVRVSMLAQIRRH